MFFFFLCFKYKNYSHDVGKPVRRVPKRKQMAQDSESQRRSALNVRLFLREFCIDFLENCYNRLMYLVKVNDDIHITETQTLSLWVLPIVRLVFRAGRVDPGTGTAAWWDILSVGFDFLHGLQPGSELQTGCGVWDHVHPHLSFHWEEHHQLLWDDTHWQEGCHILVSQVGLVILLLVMGRDAPVDWP